MRRAAWIALGLVAVAALVYAFRVEIALQAASFVADRRHQTGPTIEIDWATGPDPRGRSAAERPPNIVLIVADDLGWNDVTFGGSGGDNDDDGARAGGAGSGRRGVAGGTVPTPNIDSIAADGVHFRNGYAANATCAPSRAALLSGRYGTRFGFEFTPTPPGMMQIVPRLAGGDRERPATVFHEAGETLGYDEMGMPASEITIAELLAAQDYHTAHIGKWHVGRSNGMAPHDQGFDESLLMVSGLYLPEDDPAVVNAKQDFDPIDRFLWASMRYSAALSGGPQFAPGGYLTDYYTDQAVRVIEANRDRPFFLYLAHWAPHTPLQALRSDYEALSHVETHRERVYAAMIRSLDRGVGAVLEALERNGLEENTLVLFTSDNGGAHYIGLPEVNEPFRGWKQTLFEGGIHVPYYAKWPARIPPGSAFDAPVHHFDLFATAAAAGGAPLPTDRTIDGVNLLPYVTGEAEGVPHRALFWRSGASRTALVDGWKLNVSDPPGRSWLFDLGSDPTEQRDLADDRPRKLAELHAALAAHDATQAEPAWARQVSYPVSLDKDLSQPVAPGDEFIYWSN